MGIERDARSLVGYSMLSVVAPSALLGALRRARMAIFKVTLAYGVGILAGMAMVHNGNAVSLNYRDRIVERAQSSAISTQDRAGQRVRAAQFDFAANLIFGALPSTIVGIFNAGVYAIALYRGWIGGIVSVDSLHVSRFAASRRAAYYVSVLSLQLLPYVLAGAAGVHMGRARRRARGHERAGPMGVPADAWLDAMRLYVLVVPLFLLASLWEFLSPWR